MLLIFIIVIIVSLFAYIDLQRKRKCLDKFANVEYDTYLPFIGNLHSLVVDGIFKGLDNWFTNTKRSKLFWIFSIPFYFTKDPEEIQTILTTKDALNKGIAYSFIDVFKNSLLSCSVEDWKVRRRMLNKCFTHKQMYSFVQLFNKFTDTLINNISHEMFLRDFNKVAEKNFLNNFFASIGNSGTKEYSSFFDFEYNVVVKRMEKIVLNRALTPWLLLDFIFYRTQEGKYLKEINEKMEKTVENYMATRDKMKTGKKLEDLGKNGFLDVVFDNYSDLKQIKGEIMLFEGSSTETTSSAFASALILLGMHQDIQEKVYQEIMSVVGLDIPVEIHHLYDLKYTFMVIQETLRILPPISFFHRKADEDIELGGGKCIPKGTNLVISTFHLHRDGRYWKDPFKFDPDRFLPEEVEKRPPCCFIPFSYGPRNCIGSKYVEIVLKINLVNILRKYRVSANYKHVKDLKPPKTAFFRLPGHLKIKFDER